MPLKCQFISNSHSYIQIFTFLYSASSHLYVIVFLLRFITHLNSTKFMTQFFLLHSNWIPQHTPSFPQYSNVNSNHDSQHKIPCSLQLPPFFAMQIELHPTLCHIQHTSWFKQNSKIISQTVFPDKLVLFFAFFFWKCTSFIGITGQIIMCIEIGNMFGVTQFAWTKSWKVWSIIDMDKKQESVENHWFYIENWMQSFSGLQVNSG